MPRICADECDFVVSSGSLALNRSAHGSTIGSSQSGSVTIRTDPTDGYAGPVGVQRMQFTNNTCRRQLVRFQAYAMDTQLRLAPGNRWVVRLFSGVSFGDPLPVDTFMIHNSAPIWANHHFEDFGTEIVGMSIQGRPFRNFVDPGQTLHMLGSLWRWMGIHAPDQRNSGSCRYVLLTYETWPAAA